MNDHLKLKISKQVMVWQKSHKYFLLDCSALSFIFGYSSLIVWSTFTSFDKCPLVILPSDRRRGRDSINVVYDSQLSGFYFLFDHSKAMIKANGGSSGW